MKTLLFICVMLFAGSVMGQIRFDQKVDEVTILSFDLDTVNNQIEVVKKIKRYKFHVIQDANNELIAIDEGDNYIIKEIYGIQIRYPEAVYRIKLIKTIKGKIIPAQTIQERIEWEE